MADLFTPALFDRLLWFASGGSLTALVISISLIREPRRRRKQRKDLDPAPCGPWYESASGALEARMMAQAAILAWYDDHSSMSAMQAVAFAAEILSSDSVTGWTNDLDAVRLNVINLARRVVAAHQQQSGGRQKPQPHGGRLIREGELPVWNEDDGRNGAGGER